MGAIQNELNQLLGTSALVAGGAKHMKNEKFQAETTAKDNLQKSLEAIPGDMKEAENLDKETEGLDKFEKELDKAQVEDLKNAKTPEEIKEVKKRNKLAEDKLDKDKAMAGFALENLALKIQARKELIERSKKVLGITHIDEVVTDDRLKDIISKSKKLLGKDGGKK